MTRFLKVATFSPALILCFMSSAFANDCNSHIVDEVGKVNIDSVNKAVDSLIEKGIEPRIRLIQTHSPHGNLDIYERELVLKCESMQSPNGGKKGNLLTIIVEMEHRQVGVYYGPDYHKPLERKWKSIKDRKLTPRLKSGDFTGAFTGSMEALGKIIYNYENPYVPTPAEIEAKKLEDARKAQQKEEAKKKIKSFLTFLFGFLIIGVLFSLVASVLFSLYLARRNKKAAFAKAQKEMIESRDKVSEIFLDDANLNENGPVSKDIKSLEGKISDDDLSSFKYQLKSLLSRKEEALGDFSVLTELANSAQLSDVQEAKETYDKVYTSMKSILDGLTSLELNVKLIKDAVDGAGYKITYIEDSLDKVKGKSASNLESIGFDASLISSNVSSSESYLSQAKKSLDDRDIQKFIEFCKHAEDSIDFIEVSVDKYISDYECIQSR